MVRWNIKIHKNLSFEPVDKSEAKDVERLQDDKMLNEWLRLRACHLCASFSACVYVCVSAPECVCVCVFL